MHQTMIQETPSATQGQEKLYPIGLDSLHADVSAPCDLFRRLPDGRMIFFAREGIPFEPAAQQKLFAHGVRELYIRDEEVPRFFSYIRDTLTRIVKDPATPPPKKAEAVHVSCRETMKRAFDEPRGSFLRDAHEVIRPTVDLIVRDDNATRCLIELTAYDHCTYVHSTNVGIFGVALAKILYGGRSDHNMHRLGAGFFLHDLGKCKIPLAILNKPGALDAEERQIVNRHPEDGYAMLRECGFLTDEATILTLQHHERDDGKGYPRGLGKEDIHPYARICRIVDVYEALTAERPYHQRRSTFEALKFMQDNIMTDLDQRIMTKFIGLFGL